MNTVRQRKHQGQEVLPSKHCAPLAESPVLSVVIPCLNEAQQILESICSAQKALMPLAIEVIVVDGGSADQTVTELQSAIKNERLANTSLLISEPGRAQQMREGAAHARGEVILFLHADTRLPAQAGKQLQSFLNSKFDWGFFQISLSNPHMKYRIVSAMMNLRSRLSRISTGDQCQFLRRKLYDDIGGMPDQRLMEDVELSRRLKRVAKPFIVEPKATTSARRWEVHGYFRTILLMWSLRFRYWLGQPPESLYQRYY